MMHIKENNWNAVIDYVLLVLKDKKKCFEWFICSFENIIPLRLGSCNQNIRSVLNASYYNWNLAFLFYIMISWKKHSWYLTTNQMIKSVSSFSLHKHPLSFPLFISFWTMQTSSKFPIIWKGSVESTSHPKSYEASQSGCFVCGVWSTNALIMADALSNIVENKLLINQY